MAWLFLPGVSVKLKEILFSEEPFYYSNKVVEFWFQLEVPGKVALREYAAIQFTGAAWFMCLQTYILKILYIKVGRYGYHHPLQLSPCCFLMF